MNATRGTPPPQKKKSATKTYMFIFHSAAR